MELCLLKQTNIHYCGLISLQLSVYKGAGGIQAFMKSNSRKLAEQDESVLVASGIPYTIIRAGLLKDSPGGTLGFSFEKVLFDVSCSGFRDRTDKSKAYIPKISTWLGNYCCCYAISFNNQNI